MDDSSEAEENRGTSEKNIKRTLKTPEQIAALEEFYTEHKYPSEGLKSEAAERIGLSEKQISSWFCHRRLKDKKKHEERSGSIVQDRGSGMRQDSCGSTKQCGIKTSDPKEVESDFPCANANSMEDSSPRSSSSFHDKSTSPFNKRDETFMAAINKPSSGLPYKPSGYLKVKGDVENAAITAVKRQLGRHYKENGPLLGIEFESIPPDAFATQSPYVATGSFYVGNFVPPQASGFRKLSYGDDEDANAKYERSSYDNFQARKKNRFDKRDDVGCGKRKQSSNNECKTSQINDCVGESLSLLRKNKFVETSSNKYKALITKDNNHGYYGKNDSFHNMPRKGYMIGRPSSVSDVAEISTSDE